MGDGWTEEVSGRHGRDSSGFELKVGIEYFLSSFYQVPIGTGSDSRFKGDTDKKF